MNETERLAAIEEIKLLRARFARCMDTKQWVAMHDTIADVPTGAWYYGWVESAYARNVFAGYQCGGPGEPCDAQNRPYFRPSGSVTRAQTAKIVVLSAGWPLVMPTTPTFTDVLTTYWAYAFVETAYSQAVIGGYDCLLLTPNPTPQPQDVRQHKTAIYFHNVSPSMLSSLRSPRLRAQKFFSLPFASSRPCAFALPYNRHHNPSRKNQPTTDYGPLTTNN